jgi:hypothetical protein
MKLLYSLTFFSSLSSAQEITEKVQEKPNDETGTVNYTFDESGSDSDLEVAFYSGIERLFKNPALASGLSTGTAALNRSIESLMEAVFYGLLDNELIYDASNHAQISATLKRDVFNTSTGNYVVVDQFSLGPRYLREIGKNKLPINLKADATTNVFNIYPRSDGQRLAEREDLPYWRHALNNWLGLLPLITRILPPSFNPNEIYDPVGQLTTPFIFPLEPDGFLNMPIGSIRSFSGNAGVSIPVDFANLLDQHTRQQLEKIEDLRAALPISVFVTGEHRISVLRKSEHVAWVGLSNIRRLGGSISAEIGRTLKILSKVSTYWAGVDVPFFPVDLNLTKAKALHFDQLYEFDLRNKYAQEAYRKAVNGDFTVAHQRYLDQREQMIDTGVSFHFTRSERSIETDDESGLNLFVFRRTRDNSRSKGDVEITDADGKFFVLESRQETDDEQWEVLTGSEQIASRDAAQVRVLRVIEKETDNGEEKFKYVFSTTDEDPINITVALNIQDRHIDAEELENYLGSIRRFTKLRLSKIPKIPNRDQGRVVEQRRYDAVADPSRLHLRPHITPTYLGQFNANASVVFTTPILEMILTKTVDQMWAAFAKAFDQDPAYWRSPDNRDWFAKSIAVTKSMFMLPWRIFNIRSAGADFYWVASSAIDGLLDFKRAATPEEKLDAISKVLASSYSDRTTEALLLLADLKKIPRSVTFFTRARGNARQDIKDQFRSMNNQVVRSQTPAPEDSRQKIVEDKLAAFYPSQLKPRGVKPVILEIGVRANMVPPSVETLGDTTEPGQSGDVAKKYIQLKMRVKNIDPGKDARFYIRVENAGELQVGRFVIAEQVVSVPAYLSEQSDEESKSPSVNYNLWLNGPSSPLKTLMTNETIDLSGNIQVHISTSNDGKNWSEERMLRFRFENGMLMPP